MVRIFNHLRGGFSASRVTFSVSGKRINLMNMKAVLAVCLASLLGLSGLSRADLEPWEDYDISDAVWSVTTIKVAPNMQDAYLEGLAKTWVESN
jgi:hypothetical protein